MIMIQYQNVKIGESTEVSSLELSDPPGNQIDFFDLC